MQNEHGGGSRARRRKTGFGHAPRAGRFQRPARIFFAKFYRPESVARIFAGA